jgi:glycosyltransferase involved in cell wall biosynthesis
MAPYRGGISQYTTRLNHALAEMCDVHPISFKRQYPAWLYPGKSDIEPDSGGAREQNIEYLLDAYSPWSWRRTADHIAQSRCDLAILNWWTSFWAPGLAYIASRLRRKGVRTAFLCHNLFDHGARGVKRFVSERLLCCADAYLVHSGEHARSLRERNPSSPVLHRLHPIYDHFPAPTNPLPRRGRLELLFFGFIRPYKGLELLVEALAKLQDHDVFLTVVGEVWGNADAMRSDLMTRGAPNLELRLEYVDWMTAANYFARADVVVLPYLSATGSGVAALAYHYRKPVLATCVGGLRDAVVEGQTGWLQPPNSADCLASAIARLRREEAASMAPLIDEFCREHSWNKMAEAICQLSRSLKDSGRVTSRACI